MNLEILEPQLVQRVRAQMESGKFRNVDEFVGQALDALEEKDAIKAPSELAALRRKNFIELCDPVRGLAEDIDFSRNPSIARPLDV